MNIESGPTLENRLLSLSVGYRFGKKIKDRSKTSETPEVKPERKKTRISEEDSRQAEEERIYREKLRARQPGCNQEQNLNG
jgi:hypothetical protein